MLKMVHQLTLAGLALVLFGGLLSPVLAQAASTDAGGTETTNTSSTTTNYPISSIDGLYATYLSANGSKKVYAFPQDPKSYTKADILGNDGGDSFIKGTDAPHGIASTIRSKMVTYVKDGISLTPNETVGELMNNNTPNLFIKGLECFDCSYISSLSSPFWFHPLGVTKKIVKKRTPQCYCEVTTPNNTKGSS